MKKILPLVCFFLTLNHSLHAQSPALAEFNTRLRDFDLNADTQNGHAITAKEYDELRAAWQTRALEDREHLLAVEYNLWEGSYVTMLFRDFILDVEWTEHAAKMETWGARGLALTLSRHQSPMRLAVARKNLADLLHKGASMFQHGRFALAEEIQLTARARAGEQAVQRLARWEHLINTMQLYPEKEKIEAVNRFFTQTITQSLETAMPACDYWQSPVETLARGKGDCEDFAIAKYVSLRMLGMKPEQLRVSVVTLPNVEPHAVLFVFAEGETDPWVMDNLGSLRSGVDASAMQRLSARMNLDGMQPEWGMNEKLLTEFREDMSEHRLSSYPYEKFPAASTAFVNSYRLLPPSEWARCDKGGKCLCRQIRLHE